MAERETESSGVFRVLLKIAMFSIERVYRRAEIENSNSFFFRRPALGHEFQEMLKGFVVGAILFGGQLFGPLVELGGHFCGFFRRAAESGEDSGEFGKVHNKLFVIADCRLAIENE